MTQIQNHGRDSMVDLCMERKINNRIARRLRESFKLPLVGRDVVGDAVSGILWLNLSSARRMR